MRNVLYPPRDKDGLFIQPRPEKDPKAKAKREEVMNKNRQSMANHHNYADKVSGIANSVDPKENYQCKDCNQRDGEDCLLVDIPYIDPELGSCEDWEVQCAGDRETYLKRKSVESANYGERVGGIGYACKRCPIGVKAYEPDSLGRTIYCRDGDCTVFDGACCGLNGAPTKKLSEILARFKNKKKRAEYA